MGLFDLFKSKKTQLPTSQRWEAVGGYSAIFSSFGTDLYRSELVRSCIRPLADFTAKASARCGDPELEKLLNYRPNIYMSGHDFLQKVRIYLELTNTCMILIDRDPKTGKPSAFYPIPFQRFQAVEYQGRLFITFAFRNASQPQRTFAWEDLIALRKDYNRSDIVGDENWAVLDQLDLIQTTNEGIENAIKSTANLRGILKSTKAMLAPEAIKAQKDAFVKDYLNLENEGGVASLDATQEFTPITMSPKVLDQAQLQEFRENIYRYFGVNDEIIMGKATPDQIGSFYELRVEPFLVQLSTEMTRKVYPGKQLAYPNNWIVYEANKLQFASLDRKIALFKDVVLYGGMTINEWRAGSNMAPLPDGDTPIMRLDAAKVEEEGNEGDESV